MSAEAKEKNQEMNEEKVRANGGWITNEFLEELLRRAGNDDGISVVEKEVTAAVGAGDNYLSIIYQVRAVLENQNTGQREHRQFMIKGLPSAKILKEVAEEYGVFRKELYTYSVCLPAMRRIAEEYMPDEMDFFIAAQSYPCLLPNVLVLEDLKLSGYKMGNRREQLDFRHAVVSLESLARFHAFAVRLVDSNPEVPAVLARDELYSREKKAKLYVYVGKAIKSWFKVMGEEESAKAFVTDLEKATERVLDKVIHVVTYRNGSFMTITHGDSWTNNFMYRYDDSGRVVHAKLVDFQLVRYSSPVLDLLYFLVTSTQPDMLTERFSDLVAVYHEALVSNMEKLRLDPSRFPSLEEIHEEMRARSIFGIVSMIAYAPIVVAKPSDFADFENVDSDEMEKNGNYILEKNFRDGYYKQMVFKYLKLFQERGYLRSAQEITLEDPDGPSPSN